MGYHSTHYILVQWPMMSNTFMNCVHSLLNHDTIEVCSNYNIHNLGQQSFLLTMVVGSWLLCLHQIWNHVINWVKPLRNENIIFMKVFFIASPQAAWIFKYINGSAYIMDIFQKGVGVIPYAYILYSQSHKARQYAFTVDTQCQQLGTAPYSDQNSS